MVPDKITDMVEIILMLWNQIAGFRTGNQHFKMRDIQYLMAERECDITFDRCFACDFSARCKTNSAIFTDIPDIVGNRCKQLAQTSMLPPRRGTKGNSMFFQCANLLKQQRRNFRRTVLEQRSVNITCDHSDGHFGIFLLYNILLRLYHICCLLTTS